MRVCFFVLGAFIAFGDIQQRFSGLGFFSVYTEMKQN